MKPNSDQPLSVLILSDGKTGRLNRSKTVLAALERTRKTVSAIVEVPELSKLQKKILRSTNNSFLPFSLQLKIANLDSHAFSKPDLIVSSGGSTLYPNMMLSRYWQVPNIFCGDRKRYHSGIDLVVTMNPANAGHSNVVFALNSIAVDPRELTTPRFPPKSVGILIGGNTNEIAFSEADWSNILSFADSLTHAGKYVKIVTSPRTPNGFYLLIEKLNHSFEIIDFRQKGVGSIDCVFQLDGIIATIDSTSMVVESVCSRRPVCVVAPVNLGKFRDKPLFDRLSAEKRISVLNCEAIRSAPLDDLMRVISPMQIDVLDDLSRIIYKKIKI